MLILECYQIGPLMIKTFISKIAPDGNQRRKSSVLWLQFQFNSTETPWFESPYSVQTNSWSIKKRIAAGHASTLQACIDAFNSLRKGYIEIHYSTDRLKISSIDSINYNLKKAGKRKRKPVKPPEKVIVSVEQKCAHPLDKIDNSGNTSRCTQCGQFVNANFVP